MRPLLLSFLLGTIAALPHSAQAEQIPVTSIADMAATPLVRVNIAESLRTPPDEASLTVHRGGRRQQSEDRADAGNNSLRRTS